MSKGKVTVYTAKKVRTMDPGRSEVEAVAVLDGKVLSTGTMESIEPWLPEEIPDQFVKEVSSFIDQHN